MNDVIFSHATFKAVSGGAIATGLDAYLNYGPAVLSNSYLMQRSLTFGALVGGSIFVSGMIAPSLTHMGGASNASFYSMKSLEERLIETTLGAGIAIGANKYLQTSSLDFMKSVGVIVLSDIVGEAIADMTFANS